MVGTVLIFFFSDPQILSLALSSEEDLNPLHLASEFREEGFVLYK